MRKLSFSARTRARVEFILQVLAFAALWVPLVVYWVIIGGTP